MVKLILKDNFMHYIQTYGLDFFLIFKIYTQIHNQKLNFCFVYFKLSYSKFARDLQNAQTQTHNSITQKIEIPNLKL